MHPIINILVIGLIFAISVPGVFINKGKVNGKPTNGNILMGAAMFMILTYLYFSFTGQGMGGLSLGSLGLGGGAADAPMMGNAPIEG